MGRWPLMVTSWALLAGAFVHLAALAAGPRWMAALDAPQAVVASSVRGTWLAPVSTAAVAAMLVVFALYCLSAAGRFRRLPASTPLLILLGALLMARGLLVLPFLLLGQSEWATPIGRFAVAGRFFTPGSLFVLAIGALILIGLSGGRARR